MCWILCHSVENVCASSLAKEALSDSQEGMKRQFGRKAVEQQFQPSDQVLVLFPVPGSVLTTHLAGPYVVKCLIQIMSSIHLSRGEKNMVGPC